MRARWAVLIGLALVLLSASLGPACRRGEASETVTVTVVAIDPSPPTVGPATLRLRLQRADGTPLTGLGTIEVEGTMTHAGMQPVIATAVEESEGMFVTRDFAFTMAGDWIVIVRGSVRGDRFEARTEVNGVRSAAGTPAHQHGTPTP
ncbi:MAG: FixH family protein [Thermomicrobium sp.]|nr:FixH family protein [Thermomicrobium sp.]MDW8058635.1 FixH family protein [Thermomicrobium sp.]